MLRALNAWTKPTTGILIRTESITWFEMTRRLSLLAVRRNRVQSAVFELSLLTWTVHALKVTPNPVVVSHGYEQINVEVYGSSLLRTWFDRDLSIAGRVFYKNDKAQIHRGIINFQRPMAFIPSIAIHLQRDANERQEIDKQTHLNPMVATTREIDGNNFHHRLLQHVENELKVSKIEQILGFDLSLYDVNPPRTLGSDNEFLASARIDNLVSCYAGLRAFLDADGDNFCILVCSDHEEVGSLSDSGAQSGFPGICIRKTAIY